MKKPPTYLTVEQELACGKPPGHRLLADFLAQLGHQIPHSEATNRLAVAFRKILRGADAARALELKWAARGRPKNPRKLRYSRRLHMAVHIAGCIESDPIELGAQRRAFDSAAERFGREGREYDRRELERIWAEFRDEAIAHLQLQRALEPEHVPPQQRSLKPSSKASERVELFAEVTPLIAAHRSTIGASLNSLIDQLVDLERKTGRTPALEELGARRAREIARAFAGVEAPANDPSAVNGKK